jgi:hypothetical protein
LQTEVGRLWLLTSTQDWRDIRKDGVRGRSREAPWMGFRILRRVFLASMATDGIWKIICIKF